MEWMTMTEMVEAKENAERKENLWAAAGWVQLLISAVLLALEILTENDEFGAVLAVGVVVNVIIYFAVTVRREKFWHHQVIHWIAKMEDGE